MRGGYSVVQMVEGTAQMTQTNQPFDGYSEFTAVQAVESVTYADVNPAAAQFAQVWQEVESGVPLLTALDNLRERLPGEKLTLVLDTLKAHREVGGNLADILEVLGIVLQKE
jgi:pilus assembly protein TadC